MIDPLPHQRVAVYDHILQTWPIRFLLADDAGAGKTIMAGLTIRELLSRRLVRRVLVAPPAGLVGNWQREMRTFFRIQARVVRGAESAKGNPFSAPKPTSPSSASTPFGRRARLPGCESRFGRAGLRPRDLREAHKLSADRNPVDMMSIKRRATDWPRPSPA